MEWGGGVLKGGVEREDPPISGFVWPCQGNIREGGERIVCDRRREGQGMGAERRLAKRDVYMQVK